MKFSVVAFLIWALMGLGCLALLARKESVGLWAGLRQVGDTSLGRNSVNWMGVLALFGAVLICYFAR